jgi:hypothetical protein
MQRLTSQFLRASHKAAALSKNLNLPKGGSAEYVKRYTESIENPGLTSNELS